MIVPMFDELLDVERVPHRAMRAGETLLKRQLFALENRTVLDQQRLYREAYRNLRAAALDIADQQGISKLDHSAPATQFRDQYLAYAEQRLNVLNDQIMRSTIRAAQIALLGGYYGNLWLLDMVTDESTPIRKPILSAPGTLNEDLYDDLIQSLMGRKWREQYQTELGAMTLEVRRAIGNGMLDGQGIDEVMRRVARSMGVTTDRRRGSPGSADRSGYRANFNRVQAITRTTINEVSNAGAVNAYRANEDVLEGYAWLTAKDERVCPTCAALDGRYYDLDAHVRPPRHPNCILPGNEIVLPGELLAATKAFYDGGAVEITFSSGRVLSITPNHPILTPGGWVKAGLLKCRDNVISSGFGERIAARINPNNDHRPAMIEQIFRAFKEARGVLAGGMKVTPKDFYGDARYFNGEIDVVYADRALMRDRPPGAREPFPQLAFSGDDPGLSRLPGLRAHDQFRLTDDAPANGGVGVCDHCGTLFGAAFLPAGAQAVATVAHLNPVRLKSAAEGGATDPRLAAQFVERFASDVTLDQVVKIRNFEFRGHVYDLQVNPYELYITNGIVTKNCRCTVIPVLRGKMLTDEDGLPRTPIKLWARQNGMEGELTDFLRPTGISMRAPNVRAARAAISAPKLSPAGTPVSNALTIPSKGKIRAEVQETLNAIDSVHGDGALPEIPVKGVSSDNYHGAFYSSSAGPGDIRISTSGTHKMMTTAHETGHFIDFSGIGEANRFTSRFAPYQQFETVMDDWLKAVQDSPEWQLLDDMRLNPKNHTTVGANGYTYGPNYEYIQYVLTPEELWARSYAQYIAEESGNAAMLAELDEMRGSSFYKTQWSTESFAPIRAAINSMFQGLGWLK